MQIRAVLLQNPLFASRWPREWAVYRSLEISKFAISDEHAYLTVCLFGEMVSALVATLHRWMPSHQVQCVFIGSDVVTMLGQQLAMDTLIPLGFTEIESGVFCLWLNNPCIVPDMQSLTIDTQQAITELSAMYPAGSKESVA
ncbi:g8557 [Coccomyxa elongata]